MYVYFTVTPTSQESMVPPINSMDTENLALVMSKNIAQRSNKSDCYVCHLMPPDGRGWPMIASPYGPEDWQSFQTCASKNFAKTVDMDALAAAGNFTRRPLCSTNSIRLDLVHDISSARRAVIVGQALDLLCGMNKSLPCQWNPDEVRLTNWTHKFCPETKKEKFYGVFVYDTPAGPWQCDWHSQEFITPTGRREPRVVYHNCGAGCTDPR